MKRPYAPTQRIGDYAAFTGARTKYILRTLGPLHGVISKYLNAHDHEVVDQRIFDAIERLSFVKTVRLYWTDSTGFTPVKPSDFDSTYTSVKQMSIVSKKKMDRWLQQNVRKYIVSKKEQIKADNRFWDDVDDRMDDIMHRPISDDQFERLMKF